MKLSPLTILENKRNNKDILDLEEIHLQSRNFSVIYDVRSVCKNKEVNRVI